MHGSMWRREETHHDCPVHARGPYATVLGPWSAGSVTARLPPTLQSPKTAQQMNAEVWIRRTGFHQHKDAAPDAPGGGCRASNNRTAAVLLRY
jgi:hypothetical protein